MSMILMILVMLISILGMTIFDGNIVLCITSLILGVAYFIAPLLLRNVTDVGIGKIIRKAFMILSIIIVSFSGIRHFDGGLYNYMDKMKIAEKLIKAEKYADALSKYEEIEKEYGRTDDITLGYIASHVSKNDYDAAIRETEKFLDPKSQLAYESKLTILQLGDNASGNKAGVGDKLGDMYIEAASEYPMWNDANLMAGSVQLDRDNLGSAEYFLRLAYEQEPESWMNAFQYGVAKYRMGDDLSALKLYKEAIDNGANGEAKKVIADCIKDIVVRYGLEVE